MKILHVVRGLKNSSGTTHIVGPLAEEQARQGANVSVWFVEQGDDPPVIPDVNLVEVRCFPLSIQLPGANHPGISFPFAAELDRRIRDFDFIHIHAIWNFPTWWTMRTAAMAGIPFMVAPQGSLEPWALRRRSRWKRGLYARLVEIPLMNRAAGMQALTENEAEQIRAVGIMAPCVIIPNGVDLGRFEKNAPRLSIRLGLAPGTRTLLSLSRLDPKKGIDILIKGFARLAAVSNDITLVVAGRESSPHYGEALRRLAEQEGVADKTRFIGEVEGHNKYETFLGADVFALISQSEGLPVACLEAMAAGLPVIITPGCNLPEVGHHGAGLVVSTTPSDVTRALEILFRDLDQARAFGKNATALVKARFTWEKIAQQTIEFYRQVIEARSKLAKL